MFNKKVQEQTVDQHNKINDLQKLLYSAQNQVVSPSVLSKPVAEIANVVAVQAPKAQAIVSAADDIKNASASIPVNVGVSVQNPAMIAAANKVISDANQLLVENKKHMSNIMSEIPFIIKSLNHTFNVVSEELRMAKNGLVQLDVNQQENKLSKIKHDLDILEDLYNINIEHFGWGNRRQSRFHKRCPCGKKSSGQCRRCE